MRFLLISFARTGDRVSTGHALGCPLRLQPELLDRLLAHDELLDLAGDGHREFGHELDVAQDLVVGDLALAERANLPGRGALAGVQLDPGAGLLAVMVSGTIGAPPGQSSWRKSPVTIKAKINARCGRLNESPTAPLQDASRYRHSCPPAPTQ